MKATIVVDPASVSRNSMRRSTSLARPRSVSALPHCQWSPISSVCIRTGTSLFCCRRANALEDGVPEGEAVLLQISQHFLNCRKTHFVPNADKRLNEVQLPGQKLFLLLRAENVMKQAAKLFVERAFESRIIGAQPGCHQRLVYSEILLARSSGLRQRQSGADFRGKATR